MRRRQLRREVQEQFPVINVILKCVLMLLKVVFHFTSIQGDGCKIPAIPERIEFRGVSR